ncbi:hypothetical protein P8452_67502 [Trifolium repens]|nr:hypothetical protein P8452_67502 [Trifolium repens]
MICLTVLYAKGSLPIRTSKSLMLISLQPCNIAFVAGQFDTNTDDTGGTQMKRNRKPSEKVLELQAEKVKKPSKASKSSKPKSKSLADKSNGNESGLYSDELSDE